MKVVTFFTLVVAVIAITLLVTSVSVTVNVVTLTVGADAGKRREITSSQPLIPKESTFAM